MLRIDSTNKGFYDVSSVIINDLYRLVSSDIDEYIRKDDNIHLSDEGIKVCAEQVADIIRKASQTLEGKSEIKLNSPINDIDFSGEPV